MHTKEYLAAYRAANRERIRENYRRWREKTKRENPEKLKQAASSYYASNKEKHKESCRRWSRRVRPYLRNSYRASKRARRMESIIGAMPPELQEMRRLLYEFHSRVLRDGMLKNNQDQSIRTIGYSHPVDKDAKGR